MSRASQVFEFNTHELPRRAGEMKEYQLDLEILEPVGVALVAVPAGDVIEIDMRLESVTEGVLLSADIYAIAKGECIRCLDPIEIELHRTMQELYRYEPTNDRGGRKKKRDDDEDLDLDEEFMMEGDILNLETPIRDAIVLALPVNPLCDIDCLGLCPECGEKWATLPADHAHEAIDPRWNHFNIVESDSKLTHFSYVRSQPWRSPGHPLTAFWGKWLRDAVRAGAVGRLELLKEIWRGAIHKRFLTYLF